MNLDELKLFREALGYSESGGNYNKDLGEYWGKYQFGNARRIDIEKMLGLHHLTRSEFSPQMQEWFFDTHINDYESRIFIENLDKYFGKTIIGKSNKITANINKYGLIAGAHLGGFTGMKNYLTSNGNYDPKDSLGTHISDYIAKFSDLMEKKTSLMNKSQTSNQIQSLPGSLSVLLDRLYLQMNELSKVLQLIEDIHKGNV